MRRHMSGIHTLLRGSRLWCWAVAAIYSPRRYNTVAAGLSCRQSSVMSLFDVVGIARASA